MNRGSSVARRAAIAFVVAFAVSHAGCSGGGGDKPQSPPPTVLTGVFVDSPVAGIGFRTETRQGVTGAGGEFTYLAGEHVTFFIGSLVFPSAPAAAVVTPLALAGTDDLRDQQVVNMSVLLVSLDADGDPRNGIEIPAAAAGAAGPVQFDVPPATFAASSEVTGLVAAVGGTLVSADDAIAHLERSIGIVGTWATPAPELSVLTLFADGTFVYAEVAGDGGVEAGTYVYDAAAQQITFQVQFETNPSGISEDGVGGPHRYSALLEHGALTIVAADGEVSMTRQPVGAGIAGTWRGNQIDPDFDASLGHDVLCLLADGRFLFVEEWGVAGNGIDAGTYAYDAGTDTITFTRSFSDNANGGIFDGGLTTSRAPAALVGDQMTFAGWFTLAREGGAPRQGGPAVGLVGTWITPGAELSVLSLFSDGTFIYAETAGEPDNGLEAGTYDYDDATGTITFVVTFQHATTGGIGAGTSQFEAVLDADLLWVRQAGTGDGWMPLVHQPVGTGLAGTWMGPDPWDLSETPDPHAEVLVILADGRWILAEPTGVEPNGVEAGTYALVDGQLTFTRTFTDGTEGGFGPGSTTGDFVVDVDELSLRAAGADPDAWLVLERQ